MLPSGDAHSLAASESAARSVRTSHADVAATLSFAVRHARLACSGLGFDELTRILEARARKLRATNDFHIVIDGCLEGEELAAFHSGVLPICSFGREPYRARLAHCHGAGAYDRRRRQRNRAWTNEPLSAILERWAWNVASGIAGSRPCW